MFANKLIGGFDKRGLQKLLLLVFLALAVPTAVLIWQAYGQLKWESYHQYRGVAEALTDRIDARLREMVSSADARSFGDYTFLIVSGDPSGKFVQRSPLSAFPPEQDLPGVLGYFQVDNEGVFSTPILPPAGTEAVSLGINDSEYAERRQAAQDIRSILVDNRLLKTRQAMGSRSRMPEPVAEPAVELPMEEYETDASEAETAALAESVAKVLAKTEAVDSQQVFDDLNLSGRNVYDAGQAVATGLESRQAESEQGSADGRSNSFAKVSDLKLDANLQEKSELLERKDVKKQLDAVRTADSSRSRRLEQTALPESAVFEDADAIIANVGGLTDLRINTFESEVDPFEFSLLDSGHFVLFRKVWRDGERYTQGVLINRDTFTREIIAAGFEQTALSGMSSLILAYQNDVIHTLGGRSSDAYSDVAADLDGALLYRNRLSAPFSGLELIFSVTQLPAGPGGKVLGWVTLVLAVVFAGVFLILYRLGLSQISLSRQQQDFVSAVSHELKSPLTSIRMYGEMLKEGWAEEDKRQGYYEFIHDESERLSRLISNVLQLASITRSEPNFDIESVEVAELMSNIVSKVSSQIERAGFELRVNRAADADAARINIDEDCFAQIIINLVDNAIKFSRNADIRAIDISSRLSGDGDVLFSVRDYGPGVEKDQMKKIFQLFYRSESELTRETVGTGIGLAIVHQLTSAMGGKVDLMNAAPGVEFALRFPVGSQPLPTDH